MVAYFREPTVYPYNHTFNEREPRAWRALLKAMGCVEITPYSKDQSEYEFWTRNFNFSIDQNILELLYKNGFLNAIPMNVFNSSNQFWECFQKALEKNKKDKRYEFCQSLLMSLVIKNFNKILIYHLK